ncbi:MAG: peptidylprolyl isomerase [Desulfuromonadales bacterium]|nr:peptidylprolyl isomerase [Desulfuromonadales bacterium]
MKILVCLALLLSLVVSYPVMAEDKPVESVVAKVGNVSVTELDVQREMQKLIPLQVSYHSGMSPEKLTEIRETAIQTMIERAYKIQYAIDEEIAVDSATLENKWQNFLKKNEAAVKSAAPDKLSKQRAHMYLNLLAKKAEQAAVEDHVNISEEAVNAYYNENKESYSQPKLYTASQVFVRVNPSSNKQELEVLTQRAEDLLKRAQQGEEFYNLAYYESDDRSKFVGGSLGSFHAGQTVAEFDAALDEMEAGEISGLVRTMYGYHIIKLDDMSPARKLTMEEASLGIVNLLKKMAREELTAEWMQQNHDKYELQRFDK